jgi:hypothetical protein
MLFVFVLYLSYLIYKYTIIYNIYKIFYQKNAPESKKKLHLVSQRNAMHSNKKDVKQKTMKISSLTLL